jgi:uncharacterized protein
MCNYGQGRTRREALPTMKQLGLWPILGFCAVFCFGGVLLASSEGYGGRAFLATATCFAILLLSMLALAARGMAEAVRTKVGATGGVLLGAAALLPYLLYLLGTSNLLPSRVVVMAGLIFVPIGLAFTAGTAAPGAWQDFVSMLGIWIFVKFGPRGWLWPYPAGKLSHVLTSLVAVVAALAAFLLVRRAKGIGYSIGWGKRWGVYVGGSFLAFACIAIPLGMALRFITFRPLWNRWGTTVGLSLAILVFTAWPEELLFRGLLQNFLSKASNSELAGWWTASVLFGFSHITNLGFPNWRYVILATIAGLFYGWTWRKTGSIFASALVHGAVDTVWHFLFRTL